MRYNIKKKYNYYILVFIIFFLNSCDSMEFLGSCYQTVNYKPDGQVNNSVYFKCTEFEGPEEALASAKESCLPNAVLDMPNGIPNGAEMVNEFKTKTCPEENKIGRCEVYDPYTTGPMYPIYDDDKIKTIYYYYPTGLFYDLDAETINLGKKECENAGGDWL
ncbi:MAG: hypothetical protein OEZ22_10400 [Spirochaetia bacterium]|nr:hypothetical protein [Spirochaetia bacterium]